ncbi:MAG: amino acid permease [Legionellales bacterium]|nr:amino acid permease [Legionellales bacterium]
MHNFSKTLKQFGYKQELKRNLNVWQLTAFGLNYMIPLSPAIFFGFVLLRSGGTVVLPFFIAGIAILFTATSYSLMVRHFPLAGSLYNFVSRACHPYLGFMAGWILLLDYLLITTVTSMSASLYIHQLFPQIPYEITLIIFFCITGVINILGIQLVANFGLIMLLFIELVVLSSFLVWGDKVIQHAGVDHLFSLMPFHFKSVASLISATSLAVASYLGFDAITTLAEEAKNPIRDIPKAIFLSIFIGGLTMMLTGYLAVLAIPNWRELIIQPHWIDTALFHVSRLAGGNKFALFYSIGFVTSMALFNIVATAATARLLYGMGRDGVLNKNIFAKINNRWKTPHINILIIVVVGILLGSTINLVDIASLVNFGALLGFAILNISVIYFYFTNFRKTDIKNKPYTILFYIIIPSLGFVSIVWVFSGLDPQTHRVGLVWVIFGFIYLILNRKQLSKIE